MKIQYFCHSGVVGYAFAARNYIKALTLSGFDVEVVNLDIRKYIPDSNDIRIFHCVPSVTKNQNLGPQSYAFATFETTSPPTSWKKYLKQCKYIVSPSEFNRLEFEKFLNRDVEYIPHCLDMKEYTPQVSPSKRFKDFTFLFLGTWNNRKGYKVLIKAFEQEFSKDNINLVIKTNKIDKVKKYIDGKHNISLIGDKILDKDMPAFIKSFDCIVCPTSGEGFGLPGLQALSLEVPLIITNYSGCLEYANMDTAWLLDYKIQKIKEIDPVPQFMNKDWAVIDTEVLATAMRQVVDSPLERKRKAQKGREKVVDDFSIERIGSLWYRWINQC